MDPGRFDSFSKRLAAARSRRSVLLGLLGIGGVAAVGTVVFDDAEAARRGYSGPPTALPTIPLPPTEPPPPPTETPVPTAACPVVLCNDGCCDGACTATGACCPAGQTVCGPACCNDQITPSSPDYSECCDNACCFGVCYGEELCCPYPNPVCTVDGCCEGQCVGQGQFCCAVESVCGDACCTEDERCCIPSEGVFLCIPENDCCTDGDCTGARCIEGTCVPFTPTNTPTNTPTDTPTNTPTDTPTNTPTDTPTNTPTDTPTNTPTDTPTNTPTDTPTNTPTDTPTNTPTDTPTNTPTNTPSNTPTDTPTATATTCVPRTCVDFPDRCQAAQSDGCGSVINCSGACSADKLCMTGISGGVCGIRAATCPPGLSFYPGSNPAARCKTTSTNGNCVCLTDVDGNERCVNGILSFSQGGVTIGVNACFACTPEACAAAFNNQVPPSDMICTSFLSNGTPCPAGQGVCSQNCEN